MAREGDLCSRCGNGRYEAFRGIEVGQVFKLGTKYSESMKCVFLDEAGAERPMVMGCYGIGITRTIAAVIEQNYDADGIIWPWPVAPYHVHLVTPRFEQGGDRHGRAAGRGRSRSGRLRSASRRPRRAESRRQVQGRRSARACRCGSPSVRKALKDGVVELRDRTHEGGCEDKTRRMSSRQCRRLVSG